MKDFIMRHKNLVDAGFQPFVIADAVCSRHDQDRDVALRRMAREGGS